MPLIDFASLDKNMSLQDLLNEVAKLNKKLDYLLNGNIDTYNVRELNVDIVKIFGPASGLLMDKSGIYADRAHYFIRTDVNDPYSIVGEGQNMLRDHSFEMVRRSGSADADQSFAIDTTFSGNFYWWQFSGLPRVRSTYNTGIPPYSLFDYQSLLVNDTNYCYIYADVMHTVAPTGPYTLSVYAAPKGGNTAGAKIECVLVLETYDSLNTLLNTYTSTFTITDSYSSSDDGKYVRGQLVVPQISSSTAYMKCIFKGNSAEWIDIDGAQLVPYDHPIVYNAESNLWAHLHSLDGMWHEGITHIGVITLVASDNAHFTYLKPGVSASGKCYIQDENGVEIGDSSGLATFAVNPGSKKVFAKWLQLESGEATVSPAAGALRYYGSKLQYYDGTVWQNVASEDWTISNTAAPIDTATAVGHTHAR